jgi:hypothetical protein
VPRQIVGLTRTSIYQITYPRASFVLFNSITSSFSSSQRHFRNTGDETCDGLSNLARALIGLAICTYHRIVNPHHKIPPLYYLHQFIIPTNTNSTFFPDPEFGPPPHNHNLISPRLPRRSLLLVRCSQTTQPPSQSGLHPTSSAGKRRGGTRHSIQFIQRSGRSTPVRAAVPTSDTQWRQLPIQLRSLFRLCYGTWTFSRFLFRLLTLLLL